MLILNADIEFSNNCILSITDTTGFKSENINGFLATGSPNQQDEYHITDGYFVNAIFYNKYVGEPLFINKSTSLYEVTIPVEPVYEDNFNTDYYTLNKDGEYTIKRIFIISKEYYDNMVFINPSFFGSKIVFYYDKIENLFYEIVDDFPVETKLEDIITRYSNSNTGGFMTQRFVSTCLLNKCLYLLQKEILNSNLSFCSDKVPNGLISKRDFVYMLLQVIKYLQESGYNREVQRLIEGTNTCGLVCKDIQVKTNNDCGCG